MVVRISMRVMDHICSAAARDPRVEACGLLFGSDDRVEAVSPARNVAADPSRTFEIDPAVLIAAHRAERQGGPRLIGCYHSHPLGDPLPSMTDAASAVPNRWLWLIWGDRPALWRAVANGPVHGRFEPVQFVVE